MNITWVIVGLILTLAIIHWLRRNKGGHASSLATLQALGLGKETPRDEHAGEEHEEEHGSRHGHGHGHHESKFKKYAKRLKWAIPILVIGWLVWFFASSARVGNFATWHADWLRVMKIAGSERKVVKTTEMEWRLVWKKPPRIQGSYPNKRDFDLSSTIIAHTDRVLNISAESPSEGKRFLFFGNKGEYESTYQGFWGEFLTGDDPKTVALPMTTNKFRHWTLDSRTFTGLIEIPDQKVPGGSYEAQLVLVEK